MRKTFFHLFLSYILYNGKGRSVMLRLFLFFRSKNRPTVHNGTAAGFFYYHYIL